LPRPQWLVPVIRGGIPGEFAAIVIALRSIAEPTKDDVDVHERGRPLRPQSARLDIRLDRNLKFEGLR
jgi:hypothetical protein